MLRRSPKNVLEVIWKRPRMIFWKTPRSLRRSLEDLKEHCRKISSNLFNRGCLYHITAPFTDADTQKNKYNSIPRSINSALHRTRATTLPSIRPADLPTITHLLFWCRLDVPAYDRGSLSSSHGMKPNTSKLKQERSRHFWPLLIVARHYHQHRPSSVRYGDDIHGANNDIRRPRKAPEEFDRGRRCHAAHLGRLSYILQSSASRRQQQQ